MLLYESTKLNLNMIYVDGSKESTNLQTVLVELIDKHLTCTLVLVDRVDYSRGILAVRSGEDDRSIYRCDDGEMIHLCVLTDAVTGEQIAPVGQSLTDVELSRVLRQRNGEERAKIALAVMGRSRMDDDVVLKFSPRDLCTAYAIFAETQSRAQKMFAFDGALHLTDPQEA